MSNDALAEKAIVNHLASCLPPGVPPIYRSIRNARFFERDRRQIATAELEMFDGQPATVEVFIWRLGVAHRWTNLVGGDACYEAGRWQRQHETRQPDLFEFAAT